MIPRQILPTFDENQGTRGCSKRKRIESGIAREMGIVCREMYLNYFRSILFDEEKSKRSKGMDRFGRIWSASLKWSICSEIVEPAAISSSTWVSRWANFSDGESWRNDRLARGQLFYLNFKSTGQHRRVVCGLFFFVRVIENSKKKSLSRVESEWERILWNRVVDLRKIFERKMKITKKNFCFLVLVCENRYCG